MINRLHRRILVLPAIYRLWFYCGLLCAGLLLVIAISFLTLPGLWKLGTWLRHCPLGHRNVRIVPVLYGLRASDPEEERKAKMREIVFGGCAVDTLSPAWCGICVDCGAQYDAASKVWTVSNQDPRFNFPEPLAWPLLEIATLGKDQFVFSEEIVKGEVVTQEARAWCLFSKDELISTTTSIERILRDHQVACDKSEQANVRSMCYQWSKAGKDYSITLDHLPPDDIAGNVYFKISCNDPDSTQKLYGAMPFQGFWTRLWPGYVPVSSFSERWRELREH